MDHICKRCKKEFTSQDCKNKKTAYIKHKISCDKIQDFIEKYKWTKESIETELEILGGTVQDFSKKYPELKGKNIYKLFKFFEIDCSMKTRWKYIDSKKRKTNIERYGIEHNFCKNHPSRKKWEKKLLEDEGIINVFQRKEVKEKSIETMVKNYGVSIPYRSEEIRNKGKETCLKNWGCYHHMQNPEFLQEFIDSRIKKFGYYSANDFYKNNNHGIPFSKPHKKIVDFLLKNNIDCDIEFVLKIDKKFYKDGMNKHLYEYDILLKNSNKLIEINGDYYHGNPKIYESSDILNFFGKDIVVNNIWKKDAYKIDYAIKKGYKVLILWEYDINHNYEQIKKEILEYAAS